MILIAVAVSFYFLHFYRQNSPLPISAVVPDMELETADNQRFNLHDIKVPVVLVFYSERKWMANNIYPTVYAREIPHLSILQEEGVAQVIVVIEGVDTPDKLKEFQAKKDYFYLENISFALHNQDIAHRFGIRSWPHTFVLDRSHRVRYTNKILSADGVRKALGGIY